MVKLLIAARAHVSAEDQRGQVTLALALALALPLTPQTLAVTLAEDQRGQVTG